MDDSMIWAQIQSTQVGRHRSEMLIRFYKPFEVGTYLGEFVFLNVMAIREKN